MDGDSTQISRVWEGPRFSQKVSAGHAVRAGGKSVARATYLRRSWSVQLVQKLGAGLHDVLRALVMLPERSDKQQQQQLGWKVSAGQAVSQKDFTGRAVDKSTAPSQI